MIKLGICGNMFYDYDEFIQAENIDIVRGINFIGMGKWNDGSYFQDDDHSKSPNKGIT